MRWALKDHNNKFENLREGMKNSQFSLKNNYLNLKAIDDKS
jgi:hypothetical protein